MFEPKYWLWLDPISYQQGLIKPNNATLITCRHIRIFYRDEDVGADQKRAVTICRS